MAVTPHHMVIRIILLRQITQREDTTVAASLGILSAKGVLTEHVREAIHGTDQNAYPSLRRAILEVIAIIIIPPI